MPMDGDHSYKFHLLKGIEQLIDVYYSEVTICFATMMIIYYGETSALITRKHAEFSVIPLLKTLTWLY